MACGFHYASEHARLGFPETSLGVTPGFSGTPYSPRAFGIATAKELICSGNIISAEQAPALVLVNLVVPHEALMTETMAVALRITRNSPKAVSYAKAAIVKGYGLNMREALAKERKCFGACFTVGTHRERMPAFLK